MAMQGLPAALQRDPWSGLGTDPLWGYSPALNVLDVVPPEALDGGAVTVLLAGALDIRHLLRTVAELSRVPRERVPRLRVLLYEPNLRTYARQLLFLHFLYELDEHSDLDERTYAFLELFGNGKIRESTNAWLRGAAKKLAQFLTAAADDEPADGLRHLLAGRVSLRHMKARERDFVEDQLLYWADESRGFAWDAAWDQRMRRDLAERYDARANLIDWDYHMALADLAPLLKFPEYRQFRNTGIAFDQSMINPWRASERNHQYVAPNKTLLHWDRKTKQAAYQGDIKTGPFGCFGIETASPHLVKRDVDGSYRLGAGIVSFHNVRALLYEWVTGRPWQWTEHAFHWDLTDAAADAAAAAAAAPPALPAAADPAELGRNRVEVLLGTLELRTVLQRLQREREAVHAAYFSVHGAGLLTAEAVQALRPADGRLVVETARLLVELRDEQREAYVAQLLERAGEAAPGWERAADDEARLHRHRLTEPPKEGKAGEKRQHRLALPAVLVLRPPTPAPGQDTAIADAAGVPVSQDA